jgi:uncharacterized iron-regulated membrane protein
MTTEAQTSPLSPAARPGTANSLARRFRKWHSVLGAFAAIFLVVVGLTGIFLNHKPFFTRLLTGNAPEPHKAKADVQKVGSRATELRLGDGIAKLAIGFDRALHLATERWGDQRVEKIELRDEKGELVYRIKQPDGPELLISAATGEILERGHYEKLGAMEPDGKRARSFDWGKLMLDLHTGKIVGQPGRYVSTGVSLMLLILTLTGVYLWVKPKLNVQTARAALAQTVSLFRPAAAARQSPVSTSNVFRGVSQGLGRGDERLCRNLNNRIMKPKASNEAMRGSGTG